jgi:cation transport ATPase
MNSFVFNDAIRFRLVTQREDNNAKIQVFFGVFLGVIVRWFYGIVVDVTRGNPWNFGNWSAILARLVVALIVTFFVFSGYWEKVKGQPASMRFLNSLVYGFSIDALVGPWLY